MLLPRLFNAPLVSLLGGFSLAGQGRALLEPKVLLHDDLLDAGVAELDYGPHSAAGPPAGAPLRKLLQDVVRGLHLLKGEDVEAARGRDLTAGAVTLVQGLVAAASFSSSFV